MTASKQFAVRLERDAGQGPLAFVMARTDHRTIRFALPPLTLAGLPEPINVNIDFYARTIEAILDRLTVLRSQMPPPPSPNKRN